ncbi:MAG TPA: VWA domain-containing protein [Terracidiphilus sp.]|nr:VWA domain-containing protein [Terracidiphilus sp.]
MNIPLRIAAVGLLSVVAAAQEAGPGSAPEPLMRVTTRLVYVDVLVRDGKGAMVKGLTQDQFRVLEDGKQQDIQFFTAHGAGHADETAEGAAPAEAQTEFTNVSGNGASRPMTIVMCDLLNTPFDDQLTGRQQMLKFLRTLPPGERVTLFTLGNDLHMTRGVGGSSAFLDAATKILKPMATGLEDQKTEQMQDAQIAANAAVQFGPHFGSTAGENAIPAMNSQIYETRARGTIGALAQVAQIMSGYPGRKSLYWISESFPLSIEVAGASINSGPEGSAMQFDTRLTALQSHFNQTQQQEMRHTLNLLASARIAVYPVSVFGLSSRSASPAVGSATVFGTNPGDPRGGFFDMNNLRAEMEDLARETGGEEIYGDNGLAAAMREKMDEGANYYTIAYKPRNEAWNGQFRAIQVKTNGGSSLIYRRGYFATPDGSATESGDDLQRAMQPDVPEETGLRLRSRILPPDPQHPGVVVESTINTADVAFTPTPGEHRHAKLFVEMIGFADAEHQPKSLPETSGTLNVDLDPERYQAILSAGIAFRLQLPLKPGKYRLLVGVSDQISHKPGTLEIPVTVPAS